MISIVEELAFAVDIGGRRPTITSMEVEHLHPNTVVLEAAAATSAAFGFSRYKAREGVAFTPQVAADRYAQRTFAQMEAKMLELRAAKRAHRAAVKLAATARITWPEL